jgi:hypothetical protein
LRNLLLLTGDILSTSDEDWYILANLDLLEEKIRWLNAAGIPCYSVPMNGTNNNLTFPSTSAEQVMEFVGLGSIGYTLSSTNRDHVFVMDMKTSDTSGDVALLLKNISMQQKFVKPDKYFEAWDNLFPVFQSVYENFGITIIPDNPHGVPTKPIISGENVLYVHFYSRADYGGGFNSRDSIFGIGLVGEQRRAMMPSFHGESIKDTNGDVIAEIVENNLYILNNLPRVSGDNVTRIFERIMSAYFAIRKQPESLISKIKMGFKKTLPTNSARRQFINGCTSLIDINVSAMERTVEKCDYELSVCNQSIVNYSRERDITLQKLEPMKISRTKREEWADKEYDTLCAIPHIKNVEMENNVLKLYTDLIKITYNDVLYNMGEYKIEIYTDGSNEGVRVFNLTKQREGLQHPHIHRNGHCCLGNIAQGVGKLVAEYEYTVLAQLIVNYLQTYNPSSEYGSIRLWR